MAFHLKSLLRLPAGVREEVMMRLLSPSARSAFTTSSIINRSACHRGTTTRNYSTGTSSVNDSEVAHFNALASTWWDPQGSSRLLHLMNPHRHRFIQQCFRAGPPATSTNLKFLDIGCGGGIFAESAARLPTTASVTAIDPTPEVIQIAKRHQRHDPLLLEPGRLTYLNTAIENLPLPATEDEAYDVVSVFEVVEHIQQPAPFLEEALRHLKPGGWLVGSTIARTALSWFTTKFVAEEVVRLVPRGTHDWNQYIQPHELLTWAAKQPTLDAAQTKTMGVMYVPGLRWKEAAGSESLGNYFFAFRKAISA